MKKTVSALIVNANLDISESLKWRLPFYAPVCYLSANKNEVTIGFLLGSVLFDPAKKLQGQGKNIRHLHFHNQDEIDADLISAFLQESKQLHEAIQKQKQLAKPSDSDHLIKKECC